MSKFKNYSPCYLFQQYTTPDYEPELIKTFNNLDEVNEYIIDDINYASNLFPDESAKLEDYNKNIEFTAWKDFIGTNTLYKWKEVIDKKQNWTYIPIMTFTDSNTCHRWIQNYIEN